MIHTLRQIVQQVSRAETVEQSVTDLVNLTKAAINSDCCSLYLLDEQGLLLSASHGLAAESIGRARLQLGEGVVGTVAQREELLNLADASQHPAFKHLPETHEDDFKAFLAVPLIHRAQLVGVLAVQQCVARQFSEEEESFLITLASQLAPRVQQRALAAKRQQPRRCFGGLAASAGIAIGTAVVLRPTANLQQAAKRSSAPASEWPRLLAALQAVSGDLQSLADGLDSDEIQMLFDGYQLLLDDPELKRSLEQECQQGWSSETAVCRVMGQAIERMAGLSDEYLRERAGDLHDLAVRLLSKLQQTESPRSDDCEQAILVAEELSASMLLEHHSDRLQGLVSLRGGVNSHAAILARAMGIPAIVGVEGVSLNQLQDKPLLLDALSGQLWLEPDSQQLARFSDHKAQRQRLLAQMAEQLCQPCISADNQPVKLMLNADAGAIGEVLAVDGVSGVGLYRTEALFMAATHFPSEQQQRRHYQQMLEQAAGKPVVIRTLDVGGDKPLPYMPISEDNPFLGWRGVRLSLDHPELFLSQLRALIHANADTGNLKILVPMVARLDEIHQCQRLLHQAAAELVEELDRPLPMPELGIMIEVPAALLQLRPWLQQVDFVSVGSNDLTQYLLAVDRNNDRVGQQFDSYHPAVVQALAMVAEQCGDKPFSLCGELAGELKGALMLLALGYRDLSMNAQALGPVHYLVRQLQLQQLQTLRQQLLMARDSQQVRQLLKSHLEQVGLTHLQEF
ncbi:phosphoenolpyruvate--protein phosphotransferase [Ferrimonas senticii]|uniref:phosphoenolpyruvate--protein phosphotransferase n=1 Tax=Ferrimonas senticii TaxID=394566 RepID=UPI0003FAA736|nr:phosphoenolpyruvate--protein phosphotransferase [Ferrimonas senticii]